MRALQEERGVRRGCPFSPLPFVLTVELLATKIRSGNTNGVTVSFLNGHEITINVQQSAGDETMYLRDKEGVDEAI